MKAPLPCLRWGGVPPITPQRLDRWPGRRRPWLQQVRPLRAPTAAAAGARPPTVYRFEQPWRPSGRKCPRGLGPWGVATFNLNTLEGGHHILFLSQYPQPGGGNSHDDRTGRIGARPSMGQGRSGASAHHDGAHNCRGRALSVGGATHHCGRAGSGLTGRAGRLRPVVPPAGASVVAGAGLDQATIRPALIRLALTLGAAGQPVVALDTPRLGPWEVWLAGIVVAGRTLPIGWAVIP